MKRLFFDHARLEKVLPYIRANFFRAKTELDYETSFQFLIAVILSAQTTDKQVNKTTPTFFEKIREPKDLLDWDISEVEKHLRSVNFYRNKCRFILESARILDRDYQGNIPDTLEEILKLPGVGVKTAKVVLSVLYDAPYVWVDTHVHRVLNGIGVVKTKTPEETDTVVEKKFSLEEKVNSHHAFVLFGRYHCTARNPKCSTCGVSGDCLYFQKKWS